MKLIALNVGQDLIEVYNNMWTGVETIRFNGHTVSEQFNWFRGDHSFAVASDDGNGTDHYRVVIQFGMSGITVDVYRNEECLLAQSCEGKRHTKRQKRGLHRAVPQPRPTRVTEPERLYREEDLV
ncbi:hypothetical protein QWY85_06200 [Neolewinella lacunae]|uniref:Uncharacterized protein n=1 Tax=Neolewinella lacunae TaxID=1517758 RepID=A0A923PKU7_9BACT|nr:hypothetical protein [Neolewinella lacunae]MBC6994551.1 hypothetical protein [Neolewinella lacunae]MDN3634244.1 hypothetical protein [Neolewinella lacunae]